MLAMPCSANRRSRSVTSAVISAIVRLTRSVSSRVATPPTCGSPASDGERAAAEVQAVEVGLRRGVGERDGRRSACAAGCSCRPAARPTMPTWPPTPDRSTISRSRTCSNGRSTTPTGTTRPPRPAQSTGARPTPGIGSRAGMISSSGGRRVQRRQPDLVGGRALAGEPLEHHLQQRLGGGLPLAAGLAAASAGSSGAACACCGLARGQVAGRVGDDQLAGRPRCAGAWSRPRGTGPTRRRP